MTGEMRVCAEVGGGWMDESLLSRRDGSSHCALVQASCLLAQWEQFPLPASSIQIPDPCDWVGGIPGGLLRTVVHLDSDSRKEGICPGKNLP